MTKSISSIYPLGEKRQEKLLLFNKNPIGILIHWFLIQMKRWFWLPRLEVDVYNNGV